MGKGIGSTPPLIYQILFNKAISKNLSKCGNQVFVFSMLQIVESDKFCILEASKRTLKCLCAPDRFFFFLETETL